jgi:hypothetical protein
MPKTISYFVFYHSLECDSTFGGCGSDGASLWSDVFGIGLAGLFLLCVVAMALVMERDWLTTEIRSGSSRS